METIEEAHDRAGTEDEIAFHNQRIDQCKSAKRRMRQPAPLSRQ
jgi:hypothetical protein